MGCFFFQAEDGIRDVAVTGVQTCALPILQIWIFFQKILIQTLSFLSRERNPHLQFSKLDPNRSEERRVGKECRTRWRQSTLQQEIHRSVSCEISKSLSPNHSGNSSPTGVM